jgi:hypothetical protein
MKWTVELRELAAAHRAFLALWAQIKPLLAAGKYLIVTVKTDSRSLAQNRLMWSCLRDLSQQVEWDGGRFDEEGWKDLITATIHGQRVVRDLECTGLVSLSRGRSTSDMTIAEMVEVIEYAHAFGDLRGVRWSKTSLGRDWPEGTTGVRPVRAKKAQEVQA